MDIEIFTLYFLLGLIATSTLISMAILIKISVILNYRLPHRFFIEDIRDKLWMIEHLMEKHTLHPK